MSEPTPREETRPKPKGKGKLGPLPWWGWGLVAAAVVAGVVIWRKNSGKAAASQSGAGTPESVVPVPTGTGLTGSQYAALAAQNAAIFEAIQDMQGDRSKPKDDHDEDDEKKEDHDKDDRRRDKARTTRKTPQPLSAQERAFEEPSPPSHGVTSNQHKPPRGTHRLGNGRVVPNSVG